MKEYSVLSVAMNSIRKKKTNYKEHIRFCVFTWQLLHFEVAEESQALCRSQDQLFWWWKPTYQCPLLGRQIHLQVGFHLKRLPPSVSQFLLLLHLKNKTIMRPLLTNTMKHRKKKDQPMTSGAFQGYPERTMNVTVDNSTSSASTLYQSLLH